MTTTTETPNALAVSVKQAGLSNTTCEAILAEFGPLIIQYEDIYKESSKLTVTACDQVSAMKKAGDFRKALKKLRTTGENARKKFKDDFLRGGRAIDGIGHVVCDPIEREETRLEEQERFAERVESKRKDELHQMRAEVLQPYGVDCAFYNLRDMSDEAFAQLLESTETAHNAKISAAKKVEEDRLAAEAKRMEEEAAIRAENERLRKEAEAQATARKAAEAKAAEEAAAKLAAQRKEFEAKQAEEKKARDIAEAKAKKEREEAAAKLAEEQRKAEVKRQAQMKAEQDARAKAEAELQAMRKAAPVLLSACESVLEALGERYDGAPDSKTLWMGEHIDRISNAIKVAKTK